LNVFEDGALSVFEVLGVENVFCAAENVFCGRGTERSKSAGLPTEAAVVFGWKPGTDRGGKEKEGKEDEEEVESGGKSDVGRGRMLVWGGENGAKEGNEGVGGRVERVKEVVKIEEEGMVIEVDRGVYDEENDCDWAQIKKESTIDRRESISQELSA
jgi:hypothetical protein